MEFKIYTDGACSGNPGPGGTGFLILEKNGNEIERGGYGYAHTTNNRMEILAVIQALNELTDYVFEDLSMGRDTDIKVTVFSDSQLVVNTMNLGWSRKTNKDLWNELDKTIEKSGFKVVFEKVKGHANNEYNNIVDRLAVDAANNPEYTDIGYEAISAPKPPVKDKGLFEIEPVEAEIVEIRLKGINTKDDRLVEVVLSNGTVVKIKHLYGGFEQYDCTQTEARLTVHIAWRYRNWLNGGNL